MGNYGLPTKSEFMKWTDAGLFARRHSIIQAIDDLLEKYQGASDFLKSLTAFKIIEYCDEYADVLKRERRGSKRLSGVTRLRQLAEDEYKRLMLLIKANRARQQHLKAMQSPQLRAQQNFNKLIHNPKFKILGEIQNRGNQPDAKPLQDNEILEVLDDLHHVGHGLKAIQTQWMNGSSTKNFWDYLDEYIAANPTKEPYRVKYLNQNERLAYQISVRGGQLFQGMTGQQRPFDTKSMAINKANPNSAWGRAIFVMSIEKEIYSGGSFSNPVMKSDGNVDGRNSGDIIHHSSFLMGKPVLCAGEWLVENGGIVTVSPQSGHYRPPVKIFQNFLHLLKARGVLIDRITVEWTFRGSNHYYNALEFANANQIDFSNEPYHNGKPLRELQNMRNAHSYKTVPTQQPASNQLPPPLPPRHLQQPLRQGQQPPLPPRQVSNQGGSPSNRWGVIQPPDRLGGKR